MNDIQRQHQLVSDYLDKQKTTQLTPEFGYEHYAPHNTMFGISNDLPELIMKMNPASLKVMMRCLQLLTRSHDPVLGCTITAPYKVFNDIVKEAAYYAAMKRLLEAGFLIKTLKQSCYIVHVKYANKLYKPKFNEDNLKPF